MNDLNNLSRDQLIYNDFGLETVSLVEKTRCVDGKYLAQEDPPWRVRELTEVFS